MRKIVYLALFMGLFASCKNGSSRTASAELSAAALSKILGSFAGEFGNNKITLLITKADKGLIEGRSIVAGNNRPFSGTIKEDDGIYSVVAKEPGDNADDGTFQFTIKSAEPDVVEGTWQPFDKNRNGKEYRLHKKEFVYRTDVGEYPEASQHELKESDVENMMKSDLEQMRNEIFARHGYCFKKKEMRSMFEDLDWYIPNNTDIRALLTPVEVKNIELIKRYEKYADDYGDDFGR